MNRPLRLGLFACAGLLAFVLAGQALAAYAPKLTVTSGVDSVTLGYQQDAGSDASARVVFYAPPGIQTDLSGAVGAQIGTGSATVAILSSGGATASASGTLLVADPASVPAGFTVPIAAISQACTQTTTHSAFWLLRATINDQPLEVPLFVDQTSGPEAQFSSLKIQVCFRSPYIPPAQGGQPLGVTPLEAHLTLTNVSFPVAGTAFPWTGLFIPYTVGTGSANPLAAAESQSIASYPITLSLSGKRIVKKVKVGHRRVKTYWARLSGRLNAGNAAVAGATVELRAGAKKVATVKTNARGSFSKTMRLKRTTSFGAHAVLAEAATSGTCTPLIPLSTSPLITPTCTVVSRAGIDALSNTVRVRR